LSWQWLAAGRTTPSLLLGHRHGTINPLFFAAAAQ
jgi:hypothetical protein